MMGCLRILLQKYPERALRASTNNFYSGLQAFITQKPVGFWVHSGEILGGKRMSVLAPKSDVSLLRVHASVQRSTARRFQLRHLLHRGCNFLGN